ncbi:polyamine aminopropyltransferase [Pelagibaculum spongiae]
MALDESWYSEIHGKDGSAFSFKIKEKLHEEQTEYQQIAIYQTETFGRLMVIDDCVMLTDRDNFLYHEMMSHPALFTHADPKRVVIIGGGDCGTMKEVLKHPGVEEAWQVEIDQRVTDLSEEYFPELCSANKDPRAHFYFGDGIAWMADQGEAAFDLIIVDSTDPVGPAAGLFTQAFFANCLKALKTGGIMVQQSESPIYHSDLIAGMHRDMKAAGFADTKTLDFPQPVYPSGWWSATMAAKGRDLNNFRETDIANKPFETLYYNLECHHKSLALPEFMKKALAK